MEVVVEVNANVVVGLCISNNINRTRIGEVNCTCIGSADGTLNGDVILLIVSIVNNV